MARAVYIVDGSRTPFIKSLNEPGPFSAADLAVTAGRDLLLRNKLSASELDEVILGCVMASPDEANIGRVVSLRLGCGKHVPAYTVQRNCASGLQAIDSAMKDIAMGRHDLVLAGGTEAMSRAPLLFNQKMVMWLSKQFKAKTFIKKVVNFSKFRLSMLVPVVALLKGLTDPSTKLSMGQTAEELAYRFNISREQMDVFAIDSHKKAVDAQKGGRMQFITPMVDDKGKVYAVDNGVRADSNLEKLAKLKPFFDKKFGAVTAANSSQVSDGAAVMLLASEEAVAKYGLQPMAKVVDVQWSGVAPEVMGLGPVHAIAELLRKHSLTIADVDAWEINEAFSAQVIACLKAMASDEYCQENLNLPKALGDLPVDKLNVDGGAIALGHPVGASGARVMLHVLQNLQRNKGRFGIASLCIGGGQGGAVLIECLC